MKVFLSLALIVISLFGIVDSSYISYERFSGSTPACQPPFACGEVLNSPWASVGPVPLSILGLIFYSLVFVLGIINYLEIDIKLCFNKKKKCPCEKVLLVVTSFGFLFSIYLVSLMAFVIKAWCLYCIFSALFSSLLFITALALYLNSKKEKFSLRNLLRCCK